MGIQYCRVQILNRLNGKDIIACPFFRVINGKLVMTCENEQRQAKKTEVHHPINGGNGISKLRNWYRKLPNSSRSRFGIPDTYGEFFIPSGLTMLLGDKRTLHSKKDPCSRIPEKLMVA